MCYLNLRWKVGIKLMNIEKSKYSLVSTLYNDEENIIAYGSEKVLRSDLKMRGAE